jgi:hypothetical protein
VRRDGGNRDALLFVGAIVTYLRAHNHDLLSPAADLALAALSPVLSVTMWPTAWPPDHPDARHP